MSGSYDPDARNQSVWSGGSKPSPVLSLCHYGLSSQVSVIPLWLVLLPLCVITQKSILALGQVRVWIQRSWDVLSYFKDVKLIHIFSALFSLFLSPIPDSAKRHEVLYWSVRVGSSGTSLLHKMYSSLTYEYT